MKNLYLLLSFALTLFSCGGNEEIRDKNYPQGFSATELSFSAKGGNAIVTSQREEWSFPDGLKINGETYYYYRCEEVFPDIGYSKDNKPGICSDSLFTVKYDILKKYLEIVEIEGSWFKITKENPKQITVFIEPNLTGEIRQIRISALDISGTSISITQSGE